VSACVFCDIVNGEAPAPKHLAEMGEHCVVFEPLSPVTPGHLLVVPKMHADNAAENPPLTGKVMLAASVMAGKFPSANIITSIGAAATQSVAHLHLHVVPRRVGDGLHLPWTGQVTT
jgi:histidine triad (HIT) family protein